MYRCVLLLLPLLFLGGCLCNSENCRYPDLFQPGHISEQQKRTERFDPFTRSDIGPKIVGDRPNGALDPTPADQRHSTYR
jgi:hypothetical protein